MHAIGDAALKVTLDVFEKYGSREITNRIEHAEIIDDRDLVRFKKLNVALSMHPNHGTGVIGKYISKGLEQKEKRMHMYGIPLSKRMPNLCWGAIGLPHL